jgi:hypothetical protein
MANNGFLRKVRKEIEWEINQKNKPSGKEGLS